MSSTQRTAAASPNPTLPPYRQCQCSACGVALTGGRDTFGAVGTPLCGGCRWSVQYVAEAAAEAAEDQAIADAFNRSLGIPTAEEMIGLPSGGLS